jgi:hypothetical protein
MEEKGRRRIYFCPLVITNPTCPPQLEQPPQRRLGHVLAADDVEAGQELARGETGSRSADGGVGAVPFGQSGLDCGGVVVVHLGGIPSEMSSRKRSMWEKRPT